MKRRSVVVGAVAVAAVAGGIGLQVGRRGPDETDLLIWTRRFEQPQGGALDMAERQGRPLLLNFWATWCAPCVTEMPLLDRFQQAHGRAGWQVVGLAIDRVEPVRAFLQRVPVHFAIGIAGIDGVDLGRRLGNTGGQLPYTVVYDRSGRIRDRKLGAVSEAELNRWASDIG